jgi:putative transcriptional regulator
MTREAFKAIKTGLEESLAHVQRDPTEAILWTPVRVVREKLRWTQEQMATAMGVPVSAVQTWEAGERGPSGPAAKLLSLMSAEPEAARQVLGIPEGGGAEVEKHRSGRNA